MDHTETSGSPESNDVWHHMLTARTGWKNKTNTGESGSPKIILGLP